jgi:protein-S-isoprenylcysteine O-methyltransferase Ste14
VGRFRADDIAANGPYRYIRHPLYVSIYLFSIGLGLIFFAWLWFLVLVACAPLWWFECRHEERGMAERHGETWNAYQARTWMLIPGVH